MDPPPPAPPAASTATKKLRLMCSYGGYITTRPQTKSLYYAGGETRLVSIPDSCNLTLSSLISHLASALHFTNYPFTLKYQLPNHDFDSLISLSTDEDLLLMLDGHRRLASSPSRIRLFVFPKNSVSSPQDLAQFKSNSGNELRHPMTETWFADVLKSTKLMQKGGVGFGGDGQTDGGGEVGGVLCGAESMVLETSSSLGSSNSAVSFPNLPAKGQSEDYSVKLPLSDAITSDSTVPHPQTGFYQELESKNSMAPLESEPKILDPQIGVQVSGIPVPFQYDQPQQAQFVHTAAPHYVPQNPTGVRPMPAYYVMGSPMPQQQPMYYQTNQPPPMYVVTYGHPYSLITPTNFSSNRPPVHPNHPSAPVVYNVPEMASQVYETNQTHANLPHYANQQCPGMNVQAQPIGVTSLETDNYSNELDDDDVERAQIYKSQPPAPALPSQYQTMTKATAEALAQIQLHIENTKQQRRDSQP